MIHFVTGPFGKSKRKKRAVVAQIQLDLVDCGLELPFICMSQGIHTRIKQGK